MKLASLRGMSFTNNIIFDVKNSGNRDNCFAPYIHLHKQMLKAGITLNTVDLNIGKAVNFELHHDVQGQTSSSLNYLLMLESDFIAKSNGVARNWDRYRKVFTWRDDLVDGKKFIKIYFPNPIVIPFVDGWRSRSHFCVLIAGNKSLSFSDDRDLYKERVKTIRWFEKNASLDFDLYGVDWDLPAPPTGRFRNIHRKVWRAFSNLINVNPFPSYLGKVQQKRDVLTKARFAICYENVRDLPGYITEKIFDCFFSGCVPVYWGANNVTDYIPADCFIDRRKFADDAAIYAHLQSIKEEDFSGYQQRIITFLSSDAGQKFGSESFAETIVSTIVRDLEC